MTKKNGKVTSTSRTKASKKDDKRIRYAVVGLGHIAQNAILPAFLHAKENSVLAALISNNEEKLSKLGKRYQVNALYNYDNLEECIEEESIDAIYIAVPNALHGEFVMRGI